MANKKISQLDALGTAPAGTDILPITDVSGTPTTKKVTVANLMAAAPQQPPSEGAFVDGDKTKLDGIEAGADVTDATNVTAAGALMDSEVANLADVKSFSPSDYATSAQGTLADSAQQPPSEGAFVDGDKTKLDGIEASADVTDTTNVTAAGALMESEVTNLAQVKAFNSTDYATSTQGTKADSAVQPTDSINVLSDVDTNTVAPSNDDLLKWDGSNFVPGTVSVDVNTPLNTALRGTDNPHIGAFPNQSFKVTDNPQKSVMVIADANGNLDFVTKDGANVFVNTPSSRLALAKGFSIQADGAEPDIEAVDTDGTTYSVISGDTDTKGANGLPTRQGFNFSDIGAFPAPLLISGGTIA